MALAVIGMLAGAVYCEPLAGLVILTVGGPPLAVTVILIGGDVVLAPCRVPSLASAASA